MELDDFAIENSKPITYKKGLEIYKKGEIIHEFSSGGKYLFIAKGTFDYNVKVIVENNLILTECSCPYNYYGICKHSVAALLFIDNSTEMFDVKEPDKKHFLGNNKLSLGSINNPIAPTFVSSRYYREELPVLNTNTITQKVYDYSSVNFVSYSLDANNDIEVTCSCKSKTSTVCDHIVNAVSSFQFSQHTFQILKAEKQKVLIDDLMRDNKIPDILRKKIVWQFFESEFKPVLKDPELINEATIARLRLNEGSEAFFFNNDFSKNPRSLFLIIDFNDNYRPMTIGLIGANVKKNGDISTKRILINTYKELMHYNPTKFEEQLFHLFKAGESISIDHDLEIQHAQKLAQLISQDLAPITPAYLGGIGYDNYISVTTPVKINQTPLVINCELIQTKGLFKLNFFVRIHRSKYNISKNSNRSYNFLLVNNELFILKNYTKGLEPFLKLLPLKFLQSSWGTAFEKIISPLSKKLEIKGLGMLKATNNDLKKAIYLSEFENFVIFKPVVIYAENVEQNILESGELIKIIGEEVYAYDRDLAEEQAFLAYFKQLHPDFKNQNRDDFYHLHYTKLNTNNWLFDLVAELPAHNVTLYGLKNLKKVVQPPSLISLTRHISSKQDWFDLEISAKADDQKIPLKALQKAIINKSKYVEIGNGQKGVLPEVWIKKLSAYFRNGSIKKDAIQVNKTRYALLEEEDINNNPKILKEIAAKKEQLKGVLTEQKVQLNTKFNATLRPYQIDGFNWMHALRKVNWGGVLADDMGLGKTIQVLAYLTSFKSQKPHLIIVPTTLLFNWEQEIHKFCSFLNFTIHYGVEREKDVKKIVNNKIIITTYGILVNDFEFFKGVSFDTVVLDESQAIKNPASLRYKAACKLLANQKIALTGTPIENNTFDLFAQMNFVNPGYLGTAKGFKERFSQPIDVDKNYEIAEELQKLIKPFVLRRTKEDVAKELPSKSENYIYCSMEKEQQLVYDAFKERFKAEVLEGGSEMMKPLKIIEGLLKLRQICDSPSILNTEEKYTSESIKIKELIRHLNEKTGKHKILVFSQFVEMLKLVEVELKKNNLNYTYLDGKTSKSKRQAAVKTFQEQEECRVFLISLKAGGTGLNLTEADYVYILDPWWNPAAENQAIDRCYRIGQQKKVFAYRMICKGTVEEKIMEIQKSKSQLASELIKVEEKGLASFQLDEIKALFN